MPNIDDIYADNLRETLRQAQRYVLLGNGSSILFLLLVTEVPELLKSGLKTNIYKLGEVEPGFASIILVIAYFTFGFLANSAIKQVGRIREKINEVKIVDAVLTFPSIVTVQSLSLRLGAALLPPLLMLISYLFEYYRRENASISFFTIVGLILFALPYLVLANRLRKIIPRHDQNNT